MDRAQERIRFNMKCDDVFSLNPKRLEDLILKHN